MEGKRLPSPALSSNEEECEGVGPSILIMM